MLLTVSLELVPGGPNQHEGRFTLLNFLAGKRLEAIPTAAAGCLPRGRSRTSALQFSSTSVWMFVCLRALLELPTKPVLIALAHRKNCASARTTLVSTAQLDGSYSLAFTPVASFLCLSALWHILQNRQNSSGEASIPATLP